MASERQALIKEFLENNNVAKQQQIVDHLVKHGHPVSQGRISREFADMGIAKVDGFYKIVPFPSVLESQILGAKRAGPYLLVLATAVGAAQLVGVQLDRLEFPEVVGTISGDDTIFLATDSLEAQDSLLKKLGLSI